MVLFVVIRICTAMNAFSFLGVAEDVVLTSFVQIGLMLILPLFLISKLNKKKSGDTLEDFGFKRIDFKTVLISILIGILVFILNIAISSFFNFILGLLGYSPVSGGSTVDASWVNFAISIIIVAILPAVCEEFTHRGLLLSGYKVLGVKKAIIFSGLLFGLMHLNIGQFFYASIIGMILATVALFSRSIIPAMIIHFINNFINVYLDFARARGIFGGDFYSKISSYLSGGNLFTTLLVVILFVTLLSTLLFYLISLLLKQNAQKSVQDYAEKAAIAEMRKEVLGDISSTENSGPTQPPIIFTRNTLKNTMKVNIPYEVLGFYLLPQVKPNRLDKLFFYSTVLLGGLITLSTFLWGVI